MTQQNNPSSSQKENVRAEGASDELTHPDGVSAQPAKKMSLDELDFEEKRRLNELQRPLKEHVFGRRLFAFFHWIEQGVDRLLWSWVEQDVERAKEQERQREIRRNRPKLMKESPKDPNESS